MSFPIQTPDGEVEIVDKRVNMVGGKISTILIDTDGRQWKAVHNVPHMHELVEDELYEAPAAYDPTSHEPQPVSLNATDANPGGGPVPQAPNPEVIDDLPADEGPSSDDSDPEEGDE